MILTVIVTGFLKHGILFFRLFVPEAPFSAPSSARAHRNRLVPHAPDGHLGCVSSPTWLLAGHLVADRVAGFVIALGGASFLPLKIISIAPMLLIVAIMALEFLVAFLQAYVFAILTCIYLNRSLASPRPPLNQ